MQIICYLLHFVNPRLIFIPFTYITSRETQISFHLRNCYLFF
nr:MAG TPA: hypothetical protein [Caudoviricetes sp.]